VVVQHHANNGLRRVVFVNRLEQTDEFATAVTIFSVGKHVARVQVDPCEDRDGAMADVFVIPAHARCLAWNRRQVRGRQTNGLYARLFIDTHRINGGGSSIMDSTFGVERNILVDHQHLMHFPLEVGVTLLKVIGDLVGLELVLVQNAPDRAFAGARKARKPSGLRVFRHV
jgi:hypothetical protein